MVQGLDELDMDAWSTMLDPDFVEMSRVVRLRKSWRSFNRGIRGIEWSILKPVNNYARNLVPPPTLISNDTEIRLRYHTHADFWLKIREDDGTLWHVDRPWQRQYYNTAFQPEVDTSLVFEPTFIFYTPWIFDLLVEVEYQNISDSPFLVHNKKDMFHPVLPGEDVARPHMVPFNFKRIGDHMREEDFGIIKKPAPMFDVVLPGHGIINKRIEEFYAKYQFLPF